MKSCVTISRQTHCVGDEVETHLELVPGGWLWSARVLRGDGTAGDAHAHPWLAAAWCIDISPTC